jgi:hypothetical protein
MSNVIPIRPGSGGPSEGEIPRRELDVILRSAATRVDLLTGVIKMATEVIFQESHHNHDLAPVWCSLDLALAELDRLRNELEACDSGRLVRRELLRGMPYESKLTEPASTEG